MTDKERLNVKLCHPVYYFMVAFVGVLVAYLGTMYYCYCALYSQGVIQIMYDIFLEIINAPIDYNVDIVQACCSMVVILTTVFIDLIYRVFRHLWR